MAYIVKVDGTKEDFQPTQGSYELALREFFKTKMFKIHDMANGYKIYENYWAMLNEQPGNSWASHRVGHKVCGDVVVLEKEDINN